MSIVQQPSHAVRIVSVLALGTLAAAAACRPTVAGVDNGSSSTTTAASSGAEPATNTSADSDAGASAAINTGGQPACGANSTPNDSSCVCRDGQWICATAVEGPLPPPELA